MKPGVVISGVNLVDFGPLAVFRDSLQKVVFFAAEDAQNLSFLMEAAIRGTIQWEISTAAPVRELFAADWAEHWKMLLPSGVQNEPIGERAE